MSNFQFEFSNLRSQNHMAKLISLICREVKKSTRYNLLCRFDLSNLKSQNRNDHPTNYLIFTNIYINYKIQPTSYYLPPKQQQRHGSTHPSTSWGSESSPFGVASAGHVLSSSWTCMRLCKCCTISLFVSYAWSNIEN